jgi:hypothetical protein
MATPRRAFTAAIPYLVLAVVGAGCASVAEDSTLPRPLVRFADLPAGWTNHPTLADECTALSWRYDPGPNGWADELVGGRIAVSALVRGESCASPARPVRGYRALHRPLRLRRPDAVGNIEGIPTSVEYRFTRSIARGWTLDLRVGFAQPPSRRSRLVAQRVLDGVRVGVLQGSTSR